MMYTVSWGLGTPSGAEGIVREGRLVFPPGGQIRQSKEAALAHLTLGMVARVCLPLAHRLCSREQQGTSVALVALLRADGLFYHIYPAAFLQRGNSVCFFIEE